MVKNELKSKKAILFVLNIKKKPTIFCNRDHFAFREPFFIADYTQKVPSYTSVIGVTLILHYIRFHKLTAPVLPFKICLITEYEQNYE